MKLQSRRKFSNPRPVHSRGTYPSIYFHSGTPKTIDKSGFSSIHEHSSSTTATHGKNVTSTAPRKFILSPGLFSDSSPNISRAKMSLQTPPNLNNLVSRFDLSLSPQIEKFANTPGGKRLQKRLNDLMTTLKTNQNDETFEATPPLLTNESASDSLLLLSNTSQPDFSGIDL